MDKTNWEDNDPGKIHYTTFTRTIIEMTTHLQQISKMSQLILLILFGTVICDRSRRDVNRDRMEHLERTIELVSRQLMMQRHHMEESLRSSGDSGLKRMRTNGQGTHTYYSASHSDGDTFASMHNHPNYERLLGLGEIVAVLNGVEFRTRHNDYSLKMRHPTQRGEIVDIPFPDVPPAVRQRTGVIDQLIEMKEWFRAWTNQDHSQRDYRKYFKPVLCYLEGTWTKSRPEAIPKAFKSDRNHLDAKSWLDLADKIRFTAYSGAMHDEQNLAYLPTTIMSLDENKKPILAQWNYNILCHPLSRDLPLNRLRAVDDLKTRMAMGAVNMKNYEASRAARFQLSTYDSDTWRDGKAKWSLLDQLMSEIPGRDGYGGTLTDDTFGDLIYPFADLSTTTPLNVARYHRWCRSKVAGAGGRRSRHKGFSDVNMFVAQTVDPDVVGLTMEHCMRRNQCGKWSQKWSYAIPMEIVYMTPLSKWNPYNIIKRGDANTTEGQKVYQGPRGERDGGPTDCRAYDGVNDHTYFLTPEQFFDDLTDEDMQPADTVRNVVNVLDGGGTVRRVRNSGFWVNLPRIPGVGTIRQRYPIMPLHEEGTGVWKELEALKDIVLDSYKYRHMFY